MILAAVLAYLLIQLGIGIWISRRIHTEAEYLVAGRSLGYALATFSIFATWFGAETIVGSAGSAYREGVSLASAEPFGYGLCLILMGLVFAGPLWRRKLTTLADLFRQRYSVAVERLAAIIMIPASVLWAAAQVRAFGHVLTTAAVDLPVDTAIGVAAACVILYPMFGGLLADAITDMIQGAMLAIGLVLVLVFVVGHLGGVEATATALAATDAISLRPQRGSTLEMVEAWAIPVFGSVIAAELVGRVIAARSPEVARRSPMAAGGLYLTLGVIPVLVGLVGAGIVGELADPEQVVPSVARQLLPTALYAVFAGALISAMLSTVDSTLLVASGLLSHNLIVPIARVSNERTKVRIARGGVVTFGLAAYVLALRAGGVFELVEQASAMGSAGVLVTATFGLFTRIGGPRAAGATLLAGILVYLVALWADSPYPFLISLAAALATYLAGVMIAAGARRS